MKKRNERRLAIVLAMMMIFMNFIITPVMAAPGDVTINEANFPDDNFRKIVKTFDKDNNRILSKSELDVVTSINARDKKIENLNGIEYFTSLNWLDCSVNQLKALDLSKNINLKTLYCGQNQLTTLDLSKNINLETLFCGLNQLTTLDVSKNAKLREFSCSENQLTTLNLSKNKNLETLYCDKNPLTTLDVSKNAKLIKINCIADQLSALDVSNNINLENLFCDHNQLKTLDVSKNAKLTAFDCTYNQLSALDLSNNINLKNLFCDHNQLKTLDLSKNAQLIKFDCTYNQLSALDLNNNTNLEVLSCDQNQLTTLDLSKNTKLKTIKCRDNQLVALDLSKNIDLETLSCDQNQLAALDLTENIDIVNFTGSNQECFVTLSEGSTSLDLKTLADGFDPSKMSDLVGGTKSGNTLSLNSKPDVVTYKYEASTDNKLEVTLKIIYGEAVTVTYDWNNGSPIHSEKVPKGKEIPLKYPNFPAPDGKVFDYWEVNGDKKEAGETITVNVDTTIKAMWKVFEEIDINEENFPDANFRNYISSTFDIDHSEKLSSEELAVTSIVVNGKNIESLKGIEYFTGLRVLNCEYNQLTTLDLSRNINLTTLYCQHNQLAALDLTNNTAVTRLLGRGQERYVTVSESSKSLDLKTLADGFNPEKMSDLVGGSKSGNNLILNDDMPTTVTYEYNVKPSLSTLSVKLNVEYKKMVTITFDANGHGTAPEAITVNKGETATAPTAPTDANYDFGGWYTEAECTNAFNFSQAVNDNITLYAKWTKKTPPTPVTVTITFDANGHGTAPEAITVNKGETATAPTAPTDANYDFGGWYTESECTNAFDFTQAVNDNITLYAKWTKKTPPAPVTVTITFNANGHGTAPADITVNKGTVATAPAEPTDTEYDFGGWYTESECTNAFDFTQAVNDNITLYAKWTKKTTPPTPPTPPTPTPDPYYPGYDDWYEPYRPYRPHRPYRPAEDKKPEEKPIDKPTNKVETEVIFVIGSNNMDTKINGTDSFKGMDVAPYIKDGRTMLPIRYIAEALGMSVSWDAKTRTVIIQDMFYTVEIPVDTNIIKVNGEVFTSDVKPEIVHGRTMLPIANIARALGLKDGKDILWDAAKKQVTIIRTISR